jgi:hypothetical protein
MVEHVPNEDAISRLIYFPRMYDDFRGLIWDVVFEFPGRPCESTVWRRYAQEDDDVHHIGLDVEALKKPRRPLTHYVGFISANVGEVRSIKTARGHGFVVNHEPSEGVHHVEICFRAADAGHLKKNDKNELKLLLRHIFDNDPTRR